MTVKVFLLDLKIVGKNRSKRLKCGRSVLHSFNNLSWNCYLIEFPSCKIKRIQLKKEQNEIRQINMAADFPLGNFSSPLAGLVRFVIKIWSRVILKRKGATLYLIEWEPWPIQKQYFWILKKTNAATSFLLHFVEELPADFITFPIKDLSTVLASSLSYRPDDKRLALCP